MSTPPLSSLDFSDLPDPYLRPTAAPAAAPQPQPHPHPRPHVSTASANSASTAALDYQSFNPLTPTTLDAWIVASRTNQPSQPHLPNTTTTQPCDILSSFLPPQLDQPSINTAVSNPAVSNPTLSNPTLSLNQPQPTSLPVHPRLPASVPNTHTFTQPDRMLYTAPTRSSEPSSKPQLPTNLNISSESPSLIPPTPPTPTDGLTAVERAKKTADHFTMSQLARKRKAAGLHPDPKRPRNHSSSKSSTEEDEKDVHDHPERVSHRKYQKRLQKNRDSAFVSRIRRREYTRLLEESLTNTEKEKEAAINSFLEMKRRFDIVSAELSAFKQALAPNFTALKDSFFNQISTSSADTKPPRPGSVVTSMFMFTLLFGILLPESVRHRFGLQRSSGDTQSHMHGTVSSSGETQNTGIRSMLFGNTFAQTAPHVNTSRGKVWGQLPATAHLEEKRDTKQQQCRQDVLSTIEEVSLDLLGEEHSQQFIMLARLYLKELPSAQIARLGEVFRQDNTTRFERLAEIQSLLSRKVEPKRPEEYRSLLDHVTLQIENARL